MKTALISDTHNLLRPEALAALQGCDQITHAGDIGNPDILTQVPFFSGKDSMSVGRSCHDEWQLSARKVSSV